MPSQNRRAKTRLFNGRKQVPCCFCRRSLSFELATIEHVKPKAFGGTSNIDNLRISCRPCNYTRGTEDFDTFQRRIRADRKALIAWANTSEAAAVHDAAEAALEAVREAESDGAK